MPEFRRMRIANPHKKSTRKRAGVKAARKVTKLKRRTSPKRRRSKNPGPLGGVLTIMSMNPKKRKRNRRKNPAAKSRKRNPIFMAKRSRSRKRNGGRSRNPFAVAGHNPWSIAKLAVGGLGGAVATRAATQVVLKDKNDGIAGYTANIVVAMLLGYGAGKFLGADVGTGVLVGGLASTTQRIWDEKVSKVLPAAVAAATGTQPATVKGLGDVSYSDDGLGRLGALGMYVNADFPLSHNNGPYVPALPAATGTAPAGPIAMPTTSTPTRAYKSAW
jgi:hypothetical protein